MIEERRAEQRTMRVGALLSLAAAALFVGFVLGASAQDAEGGGTTPPTPPVPVPACNEQPPQDFLVRGNWQTKTSMDRDEIRRRREIHTRAIRYRTENYGFFEGFGSASWNDTTPSDNAEGMRAFGLRVRLSSRIVPAVRCAEEAIVENCTASPYTPTRLSGLRTRNTYHNGEVSNHVYGIAIDIDPHLNTCCHCVAEWAEHPLCSREVESIFERMAMPECWVRQFQRFGFYWLGDDRLEDTMHFEFLGDPEHILVSDGPPPHASAGAAGVPGTDAARSGDAPATSIEPGSAAPPAPTE